MIVVRSREERDCAMFQCHNSIGNTTLLDSLLPLTMEIVTSINNIFMDESSANHSIVSGSMQKYKLGHSHTGTATAQIMKYLLEN